MNKDHSFSTTGSYALGAFSIVGLMAFMYCCTPPLDHTDTDTDYHVVDTDTDSDTDVDTDI